MINRKEDFMEIYDKMEVQYRDLLSDVPTISYAKMLILAEREVKDLQGHMGLSTLLSLIQEDIRVRGVRIGTSKNKARMLGYYIHVYYSRSRFHANFGRSWEEAALKALMHLKGYNWIGNKEWRKA